MASADNRMDARATAPGVVEQRMERLPRLKGLLNGLALCSDQDDRLVNGLALDSRAVVDGDVFVALVGAKQHGLAHVEQAIINGACAVIFDPAGDGRQLADLVGANSFATGLQMPMIAVENLSLKLGELAARFYGDPSPALTAKPLAASF